MHQHRTNTSLWGDIDIPRMPVLESDIDADICVIGLGGSGLAGVDEALVLGQSVVGIDAGLIANGAAGKNGGLLLAGLADPYHTVVDRIGNARAREIYAMTEREIERMRKETVDCVRETGSLRIEASDAGLADCRMHMSALQNEGFSVEWYEGPEGKGLLLPNDAAFHPVKHCRQKVEQVLGGGARLFENTPAMAIESGKIVTPIAVIRCKHIIAAIDGRLDLLFPDLRSEVTPYRLQMAATEKSPIRFPIPMYWDDGYNYLQQLSDGRIAVGGCRDEHVGAESTYSSDPTEPVQQSIERLLRELGVDAEITHRWAATVSYSKDGLPIARELMQNVIAVGAYNGTGNLVGRILGRAAVHAAVRGDWEMLKLFADKACKD